MIKEIGKNLEEVKHLTAEGMIEKSYEAVGAAFLSRLGGQFYHYACLCTYAVVNDMDYEQVNALWNDYVYQKQYGTWDTVTHYFLTGDETLLWKKSGKSRK